MPRPIDILVYGATGFTGRLVLAQLLSQPRPMAIAAGGRPGLALARLALQHGVRAFEADLSQPARLADAFSQARVVLACAGPFADTGDALFNAALQARCHLLDLSGEPAHLRRSLARDPIARAAGIAVVHSVGFDVVPAELLAWLCRKPLGALGSIQIATAHHRGQASRGTLRSLLRAMDDAHLAREASAASQRVVVFAPPVGPRIVQPACSAEVVWLARSLGASHVRHHIASLVPGASIPRDPAETLRRALTKLQSAELQGPDLAARTANRFFIRCAVQDLTGRRHAMAMTGADPYGLSASLAAACARSAAAPGFERRGVLSPFQAFDPLPLLALMAHAGVRWQASIDPPELFEELRE